MSTRKPRRIRYQPTAHTMQLAMARAALNAPEDVNATIRFAQAAFDALRQGRGSLEDCNVLLGTVTAAQFIQRQGIVRILGDELQQAEAAINAVDQRGTAAGTWHAPTLYGHEIDALQTAIDLHRLQLSKLSNGETARVMDWAEAAVKTAKGRVITASQGVPA